MVSSNKPSRAILPILIGGLTAGTLDITYACIYNYVLRGTSPVRILQSVASGALGAKAFTGGAKTAALGGVFHFLIAFIVAAVYYLASRQLRLLVTQAVICGILYGVCVYLVMNFVVLPLSAISFRMSYPWPTLVGGLLIHMFGIGLPISLVVRRYSK
jgi:uncharacterized membrane protein YagU involved in acid resistance